MTGHHDRETAIGALVRAVPYVRLYRGRVFVVKIGGEVADDPHALNHFAEQIGVLAALGVRPVVVHGGGPQTTGLAERLGVPQRIVGGRRVTDKATLDAAIMAMNGTVNTAFVAACRAAGVDAVGLSGIDAGVVRVHVRPPVVKDLGHGPETIDFGEVGDIESIDANVLTRLCDSGFVPVMSPLAADASGRVLNVNADTVAAAVACALGAEKLIFLTGAPGILEDAADHSTLVSYTDLAGLAALEQRGALGGGMLPKAAAARAALEGGVKRVHIVGFAQRHGLLIEIFTNEGAGTLIVSDRSELAPSEGGAA